MNKFVIFDWGGVVESHEDNLKDLKQARIRMIKKYNDTLSDEEILNKWVNKTTNNISIGATNSESDIKDWVYLIQKNMNIDVPFEEFKRTYEKEFESVPYYKNVVEYVHSLKKKCNIAILSNLMAFDKVRINKQYNLSKFDKVYLSFEIGMRKPNKEIYEYVQNDLEINPQDILFIDDDEDNIMVAQACGWNTCQVFGYELDKIKQAVDNFLK